MEKNDNKKYLLYIVEDNQLFTDFMIARLQQDKRFKIRSFDTGEKMLQTISEKPDAIILDYYLDSVNPNAKTGKEILESLKAMNIETPVVIMSSSDDVEKAMELLKIGATDYIIKDDKAYENLSRSINNILEVSKLKAEVEKLDVMSKKSKIKMLLIAAAVIVILFVLLLMVLD